MLDGFVTQYCKAYQRLGFSDRSHCHPDSFSSLDYEASAGPLSRHLEESYWNEGAMLWYAHDGLGASSRHRTLHPLYLSGRWEMTRWNRADFMGVLKDQFLPDWAAEKLAELKGMEQTQSEHPAMGDMTMK